MLPVIQTSPSARPEGRAACLQPNTTLSTLSTSPPPGRLAVTHSPKLCFPVQRSPPNLELLVFFKFFNHAKPFHFSPFPPFCDLIFFRPVWAVCFSAVPPHLERLSTNHTPPFARKRPAFAERFVPGPLTTHSPLCFFQCAKFGFSPPSRPVPNPVRYFGLMDF